MNREKPDLVRLLSKDFSRVMIPNTKNMNAPLSSASSSSSSAQRVSYFTRVESTMTVMRSLVAPKKVTFLGSDGRRQAFLCKPKDDLRRDCR